MAELGKTRWRFVLVLLAGVLVLTSACGRTRTVAGQPAPGVGTLVLYDTGGQFGALGELYAMQTANLVSHFGPWTARPVTTYAAGDYRRYAAVMYLGSSYGEKIPPAFVDDAASIPVPLLWVGDNFWQLADRHVEAIKPRGFTTGALDRAPIGEVRYKGTSLTRDRANTAGIVQLTITDPARAKPVAEAAHPDGRTVPWAVRSGNLTYVAELPFSYVGPNDRYLAFTDLLFDLLAPSTPERHRALVRLEDVGPHSDPAQLRQIADFLSARHVPFSVAVFVEYDDPTGQHTKGGGGQPVHWMLHDKPDVVAALKYMVEHGGTLISHGDTHQYGTVPNPYGVSAEDFEFYRAHVAADGSVQLDGPVAEDSAAWATGRLTAARAEWAAAGLPPAQIFEFPHYAASAVDYQAISPLVQARYERAMYFSGVLNGGPIDPNRYASQYFPYPVRDVYGAPVIPETLGNVQTQQYNQHEARMPAEMLDSARRQLVVRDGTASFFYHPFLGLTYLPQLIDGIQRLGYTFTPAPDMVLK
jgi:uncharacterized protein YdaL